MLEQETSFNYSAKGSTKYLRRIFMYSRQLRKPIFASLRRCIPGLLNVMVTYFFRSTKFFVFNLLHFVSLSRGFTAYLLSYFLLQLVSPLSLAQPSYHSYPCVEGVQPSYASCWWWAKTINTYGAEAFGSSLPRCCPYHNEFRNSAPHTGEARIGIMTIVAWSCSWYCPFHDPSSS